MKDLIKSILITEANRSIVGQLQKILKPIELEKVQVGKLKFKNLTFKVIVADKFQTEDDFQVNIISSGLLRVKQSIGDDKYVPISHWHASVMFKYLYGREISQIYNGCIDMRVKVEGLSDIHQEKECFSKLEIAD